MKHLTILVTAFILMGNLIFAQSFEKDIFNTSAGDLTITFIGHGTLMMEFNGKVIHIDPVGQYADYLKMPKADLILVTHSHGDHLDLETIKKIQKGGTQIVASLVCAEQLPSASILKNGDSGTFLGIEVEAIAAYNIVNERSEGNPFHPKGEGNGYILNIGGKNIYVAGDTENTPEMKKLQNIDVAFLPMNLPYTMTPEMVADAAQVFKPKVLYPYHFGNTDTNSLVELLKDEAQIEVRVRKLN